MNYKCSMNKIMEQEKKLQEENTMRLKEELTEAQAEAQAAQSQAIAPSNNDLINRLREEVLAAEETNSKQNSYVRNLSEQKQHMETEAQEYSKHIVDYVKEINALKKTKEDLEIAQEEAYSSIAEQNEMVKEMVLKESRKMAELHQQNQELHQQNQQVLTLKKIVMDNRKIQETQEKEVQDLRDHLQAMQERMAALGIEDMHEKKIQEENDQALAKAIQISEQLAAAGQGSKQPTTPPLPPPQTQPPPSPTAPSPTAPSPSAKAVPSPKAEPSPKAPASERPSERVEDDDDDPDNLD